MNTRDIKVTLDTNVLIKNQSQLEGFFSRLQEAGLKFGVSSVTHREIKKDSLAANFLSACLTIPETAVWDETPWGAGRWGGTSKEMLVLDESPLGSRLGDNHSISTLEFILQTISDGSFPSKENRTNLSEGQRNQLRDAMILESHCHNELNIFVTGDRKAFVGPNGEKRLTLERALKIKILDFEEFETFLKESTGKAG